MAKIEVLREFFGFLMSNKKWWLGPIFAVLLLLAALLILTEATALSPFIYVLF